MSESLPTERVASGLGSDYGPLPVGTRVGRYLILERIGEGGMGEVYAAYDPKLDRRIAIKLARDADAAQVAENLGEARALAALAHPHVLTLFDVGTHGQRLFLATELFVGTSLREWQATHQPDWREALDVLLPAGRGLAAAHAAGFVHRDFKPDNVLVDEAGLVKVIDFGLAHALAAEVAPIAGLASSGTPGYAAPEQLAGAAPDARSDQFAFCVTLYELLADEPLFPRLAHTSPVERLEVMERVLQGEPWQTLAVPAELKVALQRGLGLDPATRFPEMETLLARLEAARAPRRWPRLAVAAAVLALGGFGLWQLAAPPASPCDALAVEPAWPEPAAAARLGEAFVATGVPYAQSASQSVLAAFGEYDEALRSARIATCQATHERGEQSAHLLDVRNACLDRRAREAQALFRLFETADAALVARGIEAVGALAPVAECADRESLLARNPAPETAAERAEREPLRERLDTLQAQFLAGAFTDVRDAAREIDVAVTKAAHAPISAEFHLLAARAQEGLGDYEAVREHGQAAYREAVAGLEDSMAAEAASLLGVVLAVPLKETREAAFWTALAEAEMARFLTPLPRAELVLLIDQVRIGMDAGDYAGAREKAQQAQALAEAHPGQISPWDRLRTRTNLANTDYLLGNYQAALDAYLPLVEDHVALLGADHPRVGALLGNLGMIQDDLGQTEEAIRSSERSVEITEASLGPEHYSTFIALNNLGIRLEHMQRPEDALAVYGRALVAAEASLGADNPNVATVLGNMSQLLGNLHRWEEAEAMADRALAMPQEGLPPDLRGLLLIAKAMPRKRLGGDPEPLLREAEVLVPKIDNPEQRAAFARDIARIRGTLADSPDQPTEAPAPSD